MSDEELLRLWKSLAGDTSPEPWTEDSVFGFFSCFRPTGAGVEAAIDALPHGAEVLRRLLKVYAATAEGSQHENTVDAYFTVRKAIPSTAAELEGLARRQVECWAQIAREQGDEELAGWLVLTSVEVTTAPPPDETPECDTPSVAIYEAEGDWHANLVSSCPHDHVIREAFYSIACDYTLARYITWPWYHDSTTVREPFEAYFELWRRGAQIRLPQPSHAVLYLRSEDQQKDSE